MTNYCQWRDETTMRELYVEQQMSTQQIADALGCNKSTIYDWLQRHGIETRPTGSTTVDKPWHDAATLRRLYHDRSLTTHEIAAELGCTQKTIWYWMQKHDIDTRPPAAAANTDDRGTA